jgi:hypothetical protein
MVNVDGLVGKSNFLPTVAQVKKWLETNSISRDALLMLEHVRETLAEREETESWQKKREPKEARTLTARRMRAKFRGEELP